MDKKMTQAGELEKVCRPVISCLCNYWQLVTIGQEPSAERFKTDIEGRLNYARDMASRGGKLARDFDAIEKPLIFFIDYMVKEGNFPFRDQWNELARNFDELSGDEKFFDMLDESLGNPREANVISIYYIMLALGFDGMYRYRSDRVTSYLNQTASRTPKTLNASVDPLVDIKPRKKALSFRKKTFILRGAVLGAAIIFLGVCFGVNMYRFVKITSPYKEALT
jgi:type VI protein secretion system component VasF